MSQDRPPEDLRAAPPEPAEPAVGDRRGVSRRTFLRGTAIGALAPSLVGSGLALGCAAEAQESEGDSPVQGVVGPGPVPVTLTVNGKAHELSLEPRVTLLDALRQKVGLTGAKRVCDRATCGACTVKVDGRIVYACSLLALEMQGAKIETVEALGSVEEMHPLQAAFVEGDGQQCGFCTPGFVVACSAVLEKNRNPSHEEVARGLGGNFCRCGTYGGIRRAMEGGARG